MFIDCLAIPSRHFMLSFHSHTFVTVIDIATATDITLAIVIALATTYNLVTILTTAYLKIFSYFQSNAFIHLRNSTFPHFVTPSFDLPHFIFHLEILSFFFSPVTSVFLFQIKTFSFLVFTHSFH